MEREPQLVRGIGYDYNALTRNASVYANLRSNGNVELVPTHIYLEINNILCIKGNDLINRPLVIKVFEYD